jgi:hypothetical protein
MGRLPGGPGPMLGPYGPGPEFDLEFGPMGPGYGDEYMFDGP